MRACVQRVTRAAVAVDGEVVGQIDRGLVVLLGVGTGDTEAEARVLAKKIVQLRIFEDEQGKMNRSMIDVAGAMLVVSQFTLWADCRKGRRPSFTAAADPSLAETLYGAFVREVNAMDVGTATGRFREHMHVELVNDGPVTLWLDTDELSRPS